MNDTVLSMVNPAPILLHGKTKGNVPMEIEAKFTVPDPSVYWRLQTTDHLAGYSLSTTQVKPVWDTYLDTNREFSMIISFNYLFYKSSQSAIPDN